MSFPSDRFARAGANAHELEVLEERFGNLSAQGQRSQLEILQGASQSRIRELVDEAREHGVLEQTGSEAVQAAGNDDHAPAGQDHDVLSAPQPSPGEPEDPEAVDGEEQHEG